MEIIGKVIKKTDTAAGISAAGNDWMKRTLVVETMDSQPKMLAFSVMGQRLCEDVEQLQTGGLAKVVFEPVSREHDGRWYSELRCYKIERIAST